MESAFSRAQTAYSQWIHEQISASPDVRVDPPLEAETAADVAMFTVYGAEGDGCPDTARAAAFEAVCLKYPSMPAIVVHHVTNKSMWFAKQRNNIPPSDIAMMIEEQARAAKKLLRKFSKNSQ